MLGIDAAEHSVVDSLIARRRLPALARLRKPRHLRTTTVAGRSLFRCGLAKPSTAGSKFPGTGVYHNKLWQRSRMCCVVPNERTFRGASVLGIPRGRSHP